MSFPENQPPVNPPITDAEIDDVLRQLDQVITPSSILAERKHARMPFRDTIAAVCKTEGADGQLVRFTAVCHDLSDGGLGVLSPMPLELGRSGVFTLVTNRGQELAVSGVFVSCEMIRDRVYRCGVRFDHPIDSGAFMDMRQAG